MSLDKNPKITLTWAPKANIDLGFKTQREVEVAARHLRHREAEAAARDRGACRRRISGRILLKERRDH